LFPEASIFSGRPVSHTRNAQQIECGRKAKAGSGTVGSPESSNQRARKEVTEAIGSPKSAKAGASVFVRISQDF
jgi:hypothetical protein